MSWCYGGGPLCTGIPSFPGIDPRELKTASLRTLPEEFHGSAKPHLETEWALLSGTARTSLSDLRGAGTGWEWWSEKCDLCQKKVMISREHHIESVDVGGLIVIDEGNYRVFPICTCTSLIQWCLSHSSIHWFLDLVCGWYGSTVLRPYSEICCQLLRAWLCPNFTVTKGLLNDSFNRVSLCRCISEDLNQEALPPRRQWGHPLIWNLGLKFKQGQIQQIE